MFLLEKQLSRPSDEFISKEFLFRTWAAKGLSVGFNFFG